MKLYKIGQQNLKIQVEFIPKLAETSHPDGQIAILEQLSQTDFSLTEIEQQTGLAPTQIETALKTLKNHDVIENREERYFYTVELMRRWVAQRV